MKNKVMDRKRKLYDQFTANVLKVRLNWTSCLLPGYIPPIHPYPIRIQFDSDQNIYDSICFYSTHFELSNFFST